ncbi:unnamed protein product, partial [Phaeothamnion confervicola]
MAPLSCLKEVLEMEMRRYHERAIEVDKWRRNGFVITMRANKLYAAEEARSRAYSARPSSKSIYFVSQAPGRPRRQDLLLHLLGPGRHPMPPCNCCK